MQISIAQRKIADARVECSRLGIAPSEIAKIMLDEAVLGLAASGLRLDDVQAAFKKYGKRDLPRFYQSLVSAAAERGPLQRHSCGAPRVSARHKSICWSSLSSDMKAVTFPALDHWRTWSTPMAFCIGT